MGGSVCIKNRKIHRPGIRGLTAQNGNRKMYRHRVSVPGAILFLEMNKAGETSLALK